MNLNKIGWCDFLCNPVTITCQYARTSPEWCPNDKELFMFTKEEVIAILTSMKKRPINVSASWSGWLPRDEIII